MSNYLTESLWPLVTNAVDLGAALNRWRKFWSVDADFSGVVTISRTPTATTDAVNKAYADALTPNPIVEEVDGAPSYADSDTIRFDQADGFVLTQPGAGIVRVDLAAIPNSVLANSSITLNGNVIALGGTDTLVLASADHVNEGTTTTVLHGNAAGNPSWAGVSLTLDASANQGTTTTVLHGNAAGNPSWTGVSLTADATVNQGTTTTILHGNAAGSPSWEGVSLTADAAANQGTTTTLLHGNAAGNPSWAGVSLVNDTAANQGTTATVLHGNAAGQPSFGAIALATEVSGVLPVANGGTGVAASTGTVAVVLSTSPTLVTPTLGIASATSLSFGGGVLSSYVARTAFTPTITFGGASVGITYTTQQGYYVRIGDVVTFTTYIVLSSKGSSTGAMRVAGLPVASSGAADNFAAMGILLNNFGASVATQGMCYITPGSTLVDLQRFAAGAAVAIVDTDAAATSTVLVSGSYLV